MNKTVPKSVFWIIFFVVLIDLIRFGMVFPLLPLYGRQFHLNEFQLDLILGVYSLMQFFFAPLLGLWSDRFGRRPILLLSMAGTAISCCLLAFATNFWGFFLLTALDGISGSNIAIAQAYIADVSPKEQRTRNLGMWIGAAFGLGFAFGPFFGGVMQWLGEQYLPHSGFNIPFLVAGLIAAINWCFALWKLQESKTNVSEDHAIGKRTFSVTGLRSIFKSHPALGWLIASYAVMILAFAQMEGTFSFLSADRYGLSREAIYLVFGYLGLVMAFVQGGVVRRLAPIWGEKQLAAVGGSIMVLALVALPFFKTLAFLLLFSGLLALGQSLANPAVIASISNETDEAVQGETLGLAQSFASLSRFLGPALAGFVYWQSGPVMTYLFSGLVMALAVWMGLQAYQKLSLKPICE